MCLFEKHNQLVEKYNKLENSYTALLSELDKKDKVIAEQNAAIESFKIRTQNLNSNRNHYKKMSTQRHGQINVLKKTLKGEGVSENVRNPNQYITVHN